MAAGRNQFNIYTTYYESFLALSVSIRVDEHQLMMETPSSSQAPVLRYRDITFTTEYLKELLSAVCPLLGVHNVARMRQGATLPLVEVDFTDEKALERFCKSMSDGVIQSRLQDRLGRNFFGSVHEIVVTVKLHLIMPNAEKKSPVSREVTTANYRECFSLIRESALFHFGAFNIAHDDTGIEGTIEVKLGIDDLSDLLEQLTEVAAHWYTVGVYLKIAYGLLEAIKNDNCGRSNQSMECLREMLATWLRGTDTSPAALVQALKSSGRIGLARKMAVKYGVSVLIESKLVEPQETSPQNTTAYLIKAHDSQDSRPQPIPDLNALASGQRMIIEDVQHLTLSEQLRELKDSEENVTQSFEQVKSSLESVKCHIDKLRQEQESLIEKRERKELSKCWFIKLRGSKTGEDLVQLNQMIKDTEEAVAELSNKIDELETKIKAQNEQVAEMSAQLVQKEQEKKQLEIKIDEVQKEKSSLEKKLEEDRKTFEREMQIQMLKYEQKLCKVSLEHEKETRKLESEVYEQKLSQVDLKSRHEMQTMVFEQLLSENRRKAEQEGRRAEQAQAEDKRKEEKEEESGRATMSYGHSVDDIYTLIVSNKLQDSLETNLMTMPSYEDTDSTILWLKRFWTIYNVDDKLQEKDIVKIFHPTVSLPVSKAVLQAVDKHQCKALHRGVGEIITLTWEGFVQYYDLLCGEIGTLHEVFRSCSHTHGRLGLTLEELKTFLINQCHWQEEECETARLHELMHFHDHHHGAFKNYVNQELPLRQTPQLLSYAGLLSFLRSKHNAAVNPIHNNVYQDMSQPLSHYWINSSHKTYLEGNQFNGPSSLDAYVRALLNHGSRCIEIEVWDNSRGKEPHVYHGRTFTTKLQLRDVVQTIREHAFRMSNYPLIISIDNYCSKSQQAKMVAIFQEEFRDELGQSMLASENIMETFGKEESEYRLPSPLQLQGKILLKASCKQKNDNKPKEKLTVSSENTNFPPILSSDSHEQDSSDKLRQRAIAREAQHYKATGGKVELEEENQELTTTEMVENFHELIVYCRNTSIKPWSWVEQRRTSVCQMFSFSENRAEKILRNTREMLACAERQLVRVYPKESRVDSSNYNPVPFWNHGIHMVALNYQYSDLYLLLNQGRFRQNGGCGYVLKPEVMRRPNPGDSDTHIHPFDPNTTKPHYDVSKCNLEIELLSGQNLAPLEKKCTKITVHIATYGIEEDTVEMFPRAVTDEGFWPQWQRGKHKLSCSILMPSLCLIYFKVEVLMKRLGFSQLFGQNCIALTSLQQGIKFIQLRKSSGEFIPESGLFVRIVKETTLAEQNTPDIQ